MSTPGLKYIANISKSWSLEAAATEAELSAYREACKKLIGAVPGTTEHGEAYMDIIRLVKNEK